jgi:hypothetical protein
VATLGELVDLGRHRGDEDARRERVEGQGALGSPGAYLVARRPHGRAADLGHRAGSEAPFGEDHAAQFGAVGDLVVDLGDEVAGGAVRRCVRAVEGVPARRVEVLAHRPQSGA